MPTLVAASVAPRKACTYVLCSGSSHAPTPQPSANGATTPRIATSSDGQPDLEHLPDGRLEPHLEEQHEHAEAREHVDEGVGLDRLQAGVADQPEVPEDNADDELSHHGGLTDPGREFSADTRRDQDHDQPKGDGSHRVGMLARRRRMGRKSDQQAEEGDV